MKDIDELETYKLYKECVPIQEQMMEEIEDNLQEAKELLIDIEQDLKDGYITKKQYESIKESMQEIIEISIADIQEHEKDLRNFEEFISAYEEKQQRESDQSLKS